MNLHHGLSRWLHGLSARETSANHCREAPKLGVSGTNWKKQESLARDNRGGEEHMARRFWKSLRNRGQLGFARFGEYGYIHRFACRLS